MSVTKFIVYKDEDEDKDVDKDEDENDDTTRHIYNGTWIVKLTSFQNAPNHPPAHQSKIY